MKRVQDYPLQDGSHIRGLKAIIFECDVVSCQDWAQREIVISNIMNPIGSNTQGDNAASIQVYEISQFPDGYIGAGSRHELDFRQDLDPSDSSYQNFDAVKVEDGQYFLSPFKNDTET